MKTTRRPKRPSATPADKPTSPPPPPSTATDWDLWMEKHAPETRGTTKPSKRTARKPGKKS